MNGLPVGTSSEVRLTEGFVLSTWSPSDLCSHQLARYRAQTGFPEKTTSHKSACATGQARLEASRDARGRLSRCTSLRNAMSPRTRNRSAPKAGPCVPASLRAEVDKEINR